MKTEVIYSFLNFLVYFKISEILLCGNVCLSLFFGEVITKSIQNYMYTLPKLRFIKLFETVFTVEFWFFSASTYY